MNFEEALKLADAAVFAKTNKHLRDIEIMVLSGAWEGNKYREIAKDSGYTPEYLMQDVGSNLWKLLSEAGVAELGYDEMVVGASQITHI